VDPTRNEKTDGFAVGVVLLQFLTGLPAFDEFAAPPKLWARKLRNDNLAPADDWVTYNAKQRANLEKAIGMLVTFEPGSRSAPRDVLPFLQDVDESSSKAVLLSAATPEVALSSTRVTQADTSAAKEAVHRADSEVHRHDFDDVHTDREGPAMQRAITDVVFHLDDVHDHRMLQEVEARRENRTNLGARCGGCLPCDSAEESTEQLVDTRETHVHIASMIPERNAVLGVSGGPTSAPNPRTTAIPSDGSKYALAKAA
jgi:hypothetical protein